MNAGPSARPEPAAEPDPEALVPLTPAVMHIVLALADRELHGYAIMGEVERLTDGRFSLGPGTLYRSLQRMVRDRLIVESEGPMDPEWNDERRRYYRLTPLGREIGRTEAERLAALVRIARRRNLIDGEEET